MLGPTERFIEEAHHLAEKIHLVNPTADELIIDNFRSLRRTLASQFPETGIELNPSAFRNQIEAAISYLQKIHSTDLPVFESTEMPFSKIAKHPDGRFYSVRFVTPTHELLRQFPNHEFPSHMAQGIDIIGNQLNIVIINKNNIQEVITPTPETVTQHAISRVKNTVLLSHWILDPKNLIP